MNLRLTKKEITGIGFATVTLTAGLVSSFVEIARKNFDGEYKSLLVVLGSAGALGVMGFIKGVQLNNEQIALKKACRHTTDNGLPG